MKTRDSVILQLNNLSVGYREPLLSGINAAIHKGEIILLAGKNGCGKTTLLKTIFRELIPKQGTVEITGLDISHIPTSETGKLISVVLSRTSVSPSLKVFDLIALGRYPYKKWYQKLSEDEIRDINHTLNVLDLGKYRNYYIHELSDGNLQKALIARALVQDCPLLVLDEPTAHLDISNKLEVMQIINYLAKEKGKAILFTSHDLNQGLAIADKLWLIKDGCLHTGFTEDLANRENILDYFAGTSMKFDYQTNEYKFSESEKRKPVQVSGNSPSIYWLQKALIKNNFLITLNSDIKISEKDTEFIIQYQNQEYIFPTIEEIVDFLI